MKQDKPKIYDRLSDDLPINSVVAIAIVTDPYGQGLNDKIKVLRSLRDDPLADLHSRGHIDDVLLLVGRLWQKHFDNSSVGSIRAIDMTKEVVDGGQLADPLSERQMTASRKIRDADRALGQDGCALIRDVLAKGLSLTRVAEARGSTSGRQISYLMEKFRQSLGILAELWGFTTRILDKGTKITS